MLDQGWQTFLHMSAEYSQTIRINIVAYATYKKLVKKITHFNALNKDKSKCDSINLMKFCFRNL